MGAAFEVNKQMCDIGNLMSTQCFWDVVYAQIKASREASERRFAKYIKQNEDIIMEKKTKKMAKAEAFEYLKGKRVACDNFNCVAIQHKFFDVGIKWRGGSTKATDERGSFIFVDLNGYLTHCNSRTWFDTHEYEEISADDILSIEIVEENRSEDELVEIVELGKKIQCLLSKLSGHRHVVISEDDVLLYEEGMCLFHSDPF